MTYKQRVDQEMPVILRHWRRTFKRTSPAFGGATVTFSIFSGCLAAHATAALHCGSGLVGQD